MSNVFSRLISRLRRQQLPITNYSAAGTYESPEYAPSLNIDDCGYGVDPYKQVAIIHSVISRKSNALSSANFVIQERIEGQWVTSDKHPWIIDLLENPSPYTQRYTKSDWLHLCMVHLDLLGNFVIKPIRNDEGRPIELDVIYPLHLAIEYDKIGHPLQYRHLITDDREKQTSFQRDSSFGTPISLESLIHVRYPNPDSTKFWGVAPLLALQDEVGIGKLAIHWNKNTLKDRGVTDVAFIFKDVDSESQWKLANKMVTERYANQGRKPWVLGGNAVVQPLSYSPVEMDWLRTIAFVDAKIASALGVPPLLVSSDTTSTHKNLEALQTEMWTNTILPLFRRITQRMTLYFRPVLGDNARIWIDENEIPALSLERKTRIESAEILNAMGFDAKDAAMSTNLGISRSATNELPKQQPANPKA